MPRPGYYRAWRAAHPEYRAREVARRAANRLTHGREDRSVEYANRPSRATPELPALFPDNVRGAEVAFWDEVLAEDLRQEATLARLEGRDPEEAVKRYAVRERVWFRLTTELR